MLAEVLWAAEATRRESRGEEVALPRILRSLLRPRPRSQRAFSSFLTSRSSSDRARSTATTDAKSRSRFLRTASRMTPTVAVDTPTGRFLIGTADAGAGRKVFIKRRVPEAADLDRAVEMLLASGMWSTGGDFLEVGAHIGTCTVAALRQHGFRRAIACEPYAPSARLLAANAALNGLHDRVVVVVEAISDRVGAAALLTSAHSGLNTLGGPQLNRESGRFAGVWDDEVAVPLTTIDVLVERGVVVPEQVSLVWVDAEGHEPYVLRGATALLGRCPPLVLEISRKRLNYGDGIGSLIDALPSSYRWFMPLAPSLSNVAAFMPIEALWHDVSFNGNVLLVAYISERLQTRLGSSPARFAER